MDVTEEPPPLTGVDKASMPSLTAFPAFRKQPPYPEYTGVTKVHGAGGFGQGAASPSP